MTLNEAIEMLNNIQVDTRDLKHALKCSDLIDTTVKALEEVQEYRKLGTVEEVAEAVEKTKAKKCIQDSCPDHTRYKCPSCGKIQMSVYTHGFPRLGRIPNNCDNCGQRLESEE